ncbi:hypothetical protein K505DRAFT_356097 [Melanomma pulvis-pyrius CBS 109.77]|uniref:Uncharacterized protein n=1 Tax=Melanomma pulvis-pyrius CBS 109.77 TaxID=1314802 RepID=A0A6A6XTZ8_9PLEO|nr:hypothetical protein K505DRAFT_356097 [Melanomma pulvis-pyrius CBS 109.77]
MSESSSPPPPHAGGSGRFSPQSSSHGAPVRDGRTIATALLSLTLESNPDEPHQYIVRDLMRGYIRTTLQEARMYSVDGYEVLDVHGNPVTEWAVPVAPTNTDSAFGGQMIGIEDSEDKLMEDADKHLGEGVTGEELQRRLDAHKETQRTEAGGPEKSEDNNDTSGGGGAAGASVPD